MPARDAVAIYRLLERVGVDVWIDGGWAVDALLGEQTRAHADLDIAIETRHVERLRRALDERRFCEIRRNDSSAWNFVMANSGGLEIDVHAFTFDGKGDGVYGPPENGDFYWAEALTGRGEINRSPVRCISPEWLVRFHTGYELSWTDVRDVQVLCERFGIELPAEYRKLGPGIGRSDTDHGCAT